MLQTSTFPFLLTTLIVVFNLTLPAHAAIAEPSLKYLEALSEYVIRVSSPSLRGTVTQTKDSRPGCAEYLFAPEFQEAPSEIPIWVLDHPVADYVEGMVSTAPTPITEDPILTPPPFLFSEQSNHRILNFFLANLVRSLNTDSLTQMNFKGGHVLPRNGHIDFDAEQISNILYLLTFAKSPIYGVADLLNSIDFSTLTHRDLLNLIAITSNPFFQIREPFPILLKILNHPEFDRKTLKRIFDEYIIESNERSGFITREEFANHPVLAAQNQFLVRYQSMRNWPRFLVSRTNQIFVPIPTHHLSEGEIWSLIGKILEKKLLNTEEIESLLDVAQQFTNRKKGIVHGKQVGFLKRLATLLYRTPQSEWDPHLAMATQIGLELAHKLSQRKLFKGVALEALNETRARLAKLTEKNAHSLNNNLKTPE